MFEWDEAKRAANLAKHGVDFARVEAFEFETAVVSVDDRFDYGEVRKVAFGLIGDRIYTLVFQHRGENIRVISLRKSNPREARFYADHA
ncbi:BrnT family toxin [Segnochrobactraceae bacterium EtOH-i3]